MRQLSGADFSTDVCICRAGLDQEVEPLGTPPTLHRQSSLSSSSPSFHDDQQSLRRVKVEN